MSKGYILHFEIGGTEVWFTGIGKGFTEDPEKAKIVKASENVERIQSDCIAVLEDNVNHNDVASYGWIKV